MKFHNFQLGCTCPISIAMDRNTEPNSHREDVVPDIIVQWVNIIVEKMKRMNVRLTEFEDRLKKIEETFTKKTHGEAVRDRYIVI